MFLPYLQGSLWEGVSLGAGDWWWGTSEPWDFFFKRQEARMNADVESLVNGLLRKRRREEHASSSSSSETSSTPTLPTDPSLTPRTAMSPSISEDDVSHLGRALSKSLKHISARVERNPRASKIVVRAAVQLVVAISNYEMKNYLVDEESVFALATWALETAEAAFFNQRPHTTWASINDRVFTTIVRSIAFDTKEDGLLRRQARSAFNALRGEESSSGHEEELLFSPPDLIRNVVDAVSNSSIKDVVLDAGVRGAVDFL